ncbi:glycerate kinase [Acidovorax sp. SRB_14]|uniref:glycerate kinase n=1 Tax=unclassified Acidovorax TaxID=2684926 RepID=UPI00145F8855|nr:MULTISPECIES: glycerate kinase [unclassified Acidovorax]NMM78779.1 glycerate kinase [Acidovorax sp. SRB_24]NMM81085.1 glycerate kinase [Acidovorax sp. SRB_14]NMM91737.1 glycerate kinase [Rhodococcus sp. SRB_17]
MNLRNILVPVGLVLLMAAAYRSYGWSGVAAVGGGIVMWLLLHFTRFMSIIRKASGRPIGYVGSAVMLNARLRPGVTLMHVVAMTRALGEPVSPKDAQPEVYRWSDGSKSYVTCEFLHGRLVKWELSRPAQDDGGASAPAPRSEGTPAP